MQALGDWRGVRRSPRIASCPASSLISLLAAAVLALPATASAADTLVAPDPAAQQITALDGRSPG